jgi:hypothetical protein
MQRLPSAFERDEITNVLDEGALVSCDRLVHARRSPHWSCKGGRVGGGRATKGGDKRGFCGAA